MGTVKPDTEIEIVLCTAYSDFSWEEIAGRLAHPERLLIAHLGGGPIGPEACGRILMQTVGANLRQQITTPQLASRARGTRKHAWVSLAKPRKQGRARIAAMHAAGGQAEGQEDQPEADQEVPALQVAHPGQLLAVLGDVDVDRHPGDAQQGHQRCHDRTHDRDAGPGLVGRPTPGGGYGSRGWNTGGRYDDRDWNARGRGEFSGTSMIEKSASTSAAPLKCR